MDPAEKCFFCERTSPETDLIAWFMQDERRMTHSACWLDAHRNGRQRPDAEDRRERIWFTPPLLPTSLRSPGDPRPFTSAFPPSSIRRTRADARSTSRR